MLKLEAKEISSKTTGRLQKLRCFHDKTMQWTLCACQMSVEKAIACNKIVQQ